MRKLLLFLVCALSLSTLGCKDPVVKTEMEKAGENLKEAGRETAEAGRHLGAAGEAAGREAVADVKEEAKRIQGSTGGTSPESTPAGR